MSPTVVLIWASATLMRPIYRVLERRAGHVRERFRAYREPSAGVEYARPGRRIRAWR